MTAHTVARPRARDSVATRRALLDAARRLFRDLGYDGTPVRAVADVVGVDPALVIRYFGSKEALFVEALVEERDLSYIEGPLESLAERMLRNAFAQWQRDGGSFASLLRSTNNPTAIQLLRARATEVVVAAIARRLEGSDARMRAELVTAQLLGFTVMRNLLGMPGSRRIGVEELVRLYGPALQAIITPSGRPRGRGRA
jgi:AcrR family transcriptional regulator